MKVTPEIYAWLASLNIIKPYESISKDLVKDFLIPEKTISSLLLGKNMDLIIQPLQRAFNKFNHVQKDYISKLNNLKQIPENQEYISFTYLNKIKYENWKIIFEVLSKFDLQFTETEIYLLVNNDKDQLKEIITKIYEEYNKLAFEGEADIRKKDSILNISNLDSDKNYNECNSLLELITLSLSKNMNLKPRQAIALLSNNRKYLKKVCINGYIFDFQLLKNWLSDLFDNKKLLIKLTKNSEDGLNIFYETIGTILYCKDLDISLKAGELLSIIKNKIKMNWKWLYNEGISAFIFILNKESLLYKKEFLKLFSSLISGLSSFFFDEIKKKYYLGEKKLIYDFLNNIIIEAVDMEKDFANNLRTFIYEICLSKTNDISFNLSILSETFFNFYPIEEKYVNKIFSYFKSCIKNGSGNIFSTGIMQLFILMNRFGAIKNKYAPQLYKIIVQLFLETYDNIIKREIFLENFDKFFNENKEIPIDIFLVPYLEKLNSCQNYSLCDFLFLLKIVEHPRIEGKDIADVIQFILYVCLYNLKYSRCANLILSLIFEKELITKNQNDDESFKTFNINELENQFVDFINKAIDSYMGNIFKKDNKIILETPYEIMTQNFSNVNLRIKNKVINCVKKFRQLKGLHSSGLLAMLWYYSDHDDIMMTIEEINRPIYEPMKKYLDRTQLVLKEKNEKNFTRKVIIYLHKLSQRKYNLAVKNQELLEKSRIKEEKIKNRLSEIRNVTKLKLKPIRLPKEAKITRNNSQLYNQYRNIISAQNNAKVALIQNNIKLSKSYSELDINESNNEKDIIKQYQLLLKYEEKKKYSDKHKVMKLIKKILIRKEDTVIYQDLYNKNRKYYLAPEIISKYLNLPFDLDEEEDREIEAIKGYNVEYKKNLVYYFKIYSNEAKEKISKMKFVKLLRDLSFDKERIEYKEINIMIRLMFKFNLNEFDFNQFINILMQLAYIIFRRLRPCITIGESYGNLLKRFVIKQINAEQITHLQKKYRDVIRYILQLRRNKEQFNMPEGFKLVKKTNVKYNYRLATHMADYIGEAKLICYQIIEEIIFDCCNSSLIEPYIDVNVIETVEIEPENIHNWSPGLTMAYIDLDKKLQFFGLFAADALEDGIRRMIRRNYEEDPEGDEMRYTKRIFNLKWAKEGIKKKRKIRNEIIIKNEKKKIDPEPEGNKFKIEKNKEKLGEIKKKFKEIQKKIEDEKIRIKEEIKLKDKYELEQEEKKRKANKYINLECNKKMKMQLKNIMEKRTGIRKEKEEEEKKEANRLKRKVYFISEEEKKNNDFEKNIYNSIKKIIEKKEIKECIDKYSNHLKVIYEIYSKMSLNKLNSKAVIHIDEFNQFLLNFTILGVYISLEQMNWIFKNISKVSQNKRNNELFLDFEDFKLSIGYLTIFSDLEVKSWKLKPQNIEEINEEKIEKFFKNLGFKLPFDKIELEKFVNERRNMSAKNFINLQQSKIKEEKKSINNKLFTNNEEIKVNSISHTYNYNKINYIKKSTIKNIKAEDKKENINLNKPIDKDIIKEENIEDNKEDIMEKVQEKSEKEKDENDNKDIDNKSIKATINEENEKGIEENEKNDKEEKGDINNIKEEKKDEEKIITNKNDEKKNENIKKEGDKNKKEEKKKEEEEEQEDDEEEEEEEDDE